MDYDKLLNKKSIFIGFIFTAPDLSEGDDLHTVCLMEFVFSKKIIRIL